MKIKKKSGPASRKIKKKSGPASRFGHPAMTNLSKESYEYIEAEAANQRRSISSLIRIWIEERLEARSKGKAA